MQATTLLSNLYQDGIVVKHLLIHPKVEGSNVTATAKYKRV
jgi:hypothetical protein